MVDKNEKAFTDIYLNNSWGDRESRSGAGSTIAHTASIREDIEGLIDSLKLKVILDAPCGDYNWFKLIKRNDDVKYIGGDIVDLLISDNNEKYGNDNTKFVKLDITSDPLPSADLMLCRDCLQHLTNEDVFKFIENFKKSNIKYLLVTISDVPVNHDTHSGGFRFLDLRKPPFSFGKCIKIFDEWTWGDHPRKLLVLWDRDNI
jgi:SAM-dependent methyltransferase